MKSIQFQATGMTRDMSQHVFDASSAYEIRNMRLIATDDQTTLALVNEKGTSLMSGGEDEDEDGLDTATEIKGIVIGSIRYEDYIIYFTTTTEADITGDEATNDIDSYDDAVDFIYRVKYVDEETYQIAVIYYGDMNFSALHPIQAQLRIDTVSEVYVYWTDGVNEVRRLNIFNTTTATTANENEIRLLPQIPIVEGTVEKGYGSGNFTAGVVQYFATVFNKGGAESNFIWKSPIQYLTNDAWGLEEGSSANCYFTITITQTSDVSGISLGSFDYVRFYSAVRTTLNGDATCSLLGSFDITSSTDSTTNITTYTCTYTDTNDNLTSVDVSLLSSYKYPIIAKTIQAKQDRLFLGGVKTQTNTVAEKISLTSSDYTLNVSPTASTAYSPDDGQLDDGADVVTTFRNREYYAFGFITYNKYGVPSDVIPVGYNQINSNSGYKIIPTITLNSSLISTLQENNIIKVEPVIVEGNSATRTIETQGWTNHTVFNFYDRFSSGNIMPSWFLRTSGYARTLLWDQEGYYETDDIRKAQINRNEKQGNSELHVYRHHVYPYHGQYNSENSSAVSISSGDNNRTCITWAEPIPYDETGDKVSDDEIGTDYQSLTTPAADGNMVFTGVVSAAHFQSISYGWSRNCEVQSTVRIPSMLHYNANGGGDGNVDIDYLSADNGSYVVMQAGQINIRIH